MQSTEIKEGSLANPIHPSLVRPILLAGADRTLVLLNITCIVMLLFGVGLHLGTIAAALFFAFAGHGTLLRLAKFDPDFSRVYLRHIRYKGFYPALSSSLAKAGLPK